MVAAHHSQGPEVRAVLDRPMPHMPAKVSLGAHLGDLAINGLLASHRSYDGGTCLPRHEHGSPYLCVVLAGGYVQTAKNEMECGRGALVSHPSGHAHANHFGGRTTRCVNLYLEGAWIDDPSLDGLFRDYGQVRLDPRDAALCRLDAEVAAGEAGSALVVASAALAIVDRVVRTKADTAPVWLARVREAIACDLAEPPSLLMLAGVADVHPAHLCRSFRAAAGETIGAYSRRIRLEAADAMLPGSQSIAQIAADTGFYDQSHFARCFKRHFGISPSLRRMQLLS